MLTQGVGLAIRCITPRPPSFCRVCFDMDTLLGAGLGNGALAAGSGLLGDQGAHPKMLMLNALALNPHGIVGVGP